MCSQPEEGSSFVCKLSVVEGTDVGLFDCNRTLYSPLKQGTGLMMSLVDLEYDDRCVSDGAGFESNV